MFLTAALLVALALATPFAPTSPEPGLRLGGPVATCSQVILSAHVQVDRARVVGRMQCRVGAAGTLWVARYPELLAHRDGTEELTALWTYPDGFVPAKMHVCRDGVADTAGSYTDGPWQSLGYAAAGETVSWQFATELPARQGPFGLRGPVATLLGGWHPIVGSGPSELPQLFVAPIHYSVQVPEKTAGFVGQKPFGRQSMRCRRGKHIGTQVPALVAPQLHVHTGHHATLIAAGSYTHALAAHNDISAALDEPAHTQALETILQGQTFLAEMRAAAAAEAGQPVSCTSATPPTLIVVTSLREHLAEAFEGGVALSDRAFHLLPFEMLRRFHRASLWREQLRAAILPDIRRSEVMWAPEVVADATAAAITRALLEATGQVAYAPELLERYSVSPEIDALVYAPQIPFPEVYYSAVNEGMRPSFRFDALLAPLPRGKILFEKLRDRVGTTAAVRVLMAGLAPHAQPLRQRLANAFGEDVAAALALWLGPYPRVDYLLTQEKSDRTHTSVQVGLTGPDATRLVEPVTVAVVDADRKTHTATRMGPGVLNFLVPGPARVVQVDPAGRLVELEHPPRVQARYNNRRPHRHKALLNDLSATLDVTGKALAASTDVLIRHIDDMRYDAHLGAFFGPYSYGAQLSGATHFGRELTPLKLAQTVSVTITASHLRVDPVAQAIAGRQLTVGADYRYDTRLNRITSLSGTGIDAGVTVGLTHLYRAHRPTPWVQLGLSGLHLWPTGRNQALVLRLRGDTILGDAPAQAELRLGGRYLGARGFQIDEGQGPHRALLSAEYRHMLVGDSRTDIFGLMTLTRVEGAVFGDVVYMPKRSPAGGAPVLYDVGYGVRLMGDVLGVSPAALAIDVALPIGRYHDGLARLPVTIYLAFVQSFFAF